MNTFLTYIEQKKSFKTNTMFLEPRNIFFCLFEIGHANCLTIEESKIIMWRHLLEWIHNTNDS